ncbi:MAG: right-handed parallel beta-helix repeat-containing protein [Dysgonamonadaceae bacterium]|jgi:hypothetical protein|nr:right-handed parallel beta-helix repeat-containing protein [Dysgonamonadaceae bacterium]
MKKLFLIHVFIWFAWYTQASIYYASPDGSAANSGTAPDLPADIYSAVAGAQAGDVIYLLSGKYNLSQTLVLSQSGTAEAPISILAYDAWTPFDIRNPLSAQNIATRPVLSFTDMPHSARGDKKADADKARGVHHTGNYWIIKGVNFTDAGDNGVKLEGSYNVYELCNFWRNGDTGHQIGFSHNASDNPGLLKGAYNRIINCDSWDNWDHPDWGDADGFACKMYPGMGNEYHGCRAWNNSDDGWDCFEIQTPVLLNNCWTWKNAREPGKSGNGNGFKLGGAPSKGNHLLYRCIAWGNKARGFDQNSNSDGCWMYNCLSFDNNYNYMFEKSGNGNNIAINCVEWGKKGGMALEFKAPYLLENNSWQLFDGATDAKTEGKFSKLTAHADEYLPEFLSEAAFLAPRNADGSLPPVALLKEGSRFIDAGVTYSVKNPNTGDELFSGVKDGKPDLGYVEYTADLPGNPEPGEDDPGEEENPGEDDPGNPENPAGNGKIIEEASLSVAAKGGTSKVWGYFNLKAISRATLNMQASGSSNNPVVLEYSLDNHQWIQVGEPVRNNSTNKQEARTVDASATPLNVNLYFRLRSTGNYAAAISGFILYGEVNSASTQWQTVAPDRPVSEAFYSLSGIKTARPLPNTVYIRKTVYESGKSITQKIRN